MSLETNKTIKEIMDNIEGVELKEKHGGKFKFKMYLTRQMIDENLEALDLSVRSYNSLKRAGYDRIGELTADIAKGKSPLSLRNCGSKSAREIMEHLFLYQYYSLQPEQRDRYLCEVIALNGELDPGGTARKDV